MSEVGRNDPCPCASGVKYKKCCLNRSVAVLPAYRPADRAEKKALEIPSDEQQRLLGEFYQRHCRNWLDEPIPALGDRTPRHAAKLKTIRPKLIALLKDFESQSERQRRAGEIAYDSRWMWAELGLTRE